MKTLVLGTMAVLLATSYASAIAATKTVTMTNTVTIANNCTVAATGFTTTYDPVITNALVAQPATASVTTTCTLGNSPVVTLNEGIHKGVGSTPAAPARRVMNGSTFLNYGLYSDAARLVTWGNTPLTGVTVLGTGLPSQVTIYAQLPAGQVGVSGTYTDTVIATVTY